MDELESLRAELAELCAKFLREAAGDAALRGLIEDVIAQLAVPPFYVVACSEFGRGKSTLFSALAGRRQVFPHEPTDTTSIVTTLAWGPAEEAKITIGDADGAPPSQVTVGLNDVRRYVTAAAASNGEQCVLLVEMRAPLDPLRGGLILVDTPGVNSRNEAHNVATLQYLSKADLILFVASADEPLSTLELAVLEQAARQCPRVEVVLAKADLGGSEELAVSASERVSGVLGRPADVLPVSAVMFLDACDDHLPALEGDSQIPALASRLAAHQHVHRAGVWLRAATPLVRAITLLAEPSLRELAVLREAADQGDAVDREIAKVEAQISALADSSRHFHAEIATQVAEGFTAIRGEVTQRCDDLARQLRTDQRLPKPLVDPDTYIRTVLETLTGIADTAETRRLAFKQRIVEAGERLTEAEFAPSAEADSLRSALRLSSTALSYGDRPGFSFSALKEGLSSGAKMAAATGPVGGIIGGSVAAAPGALAGATIGALLGHMIGWIGGTRDAIRRARADWHASNVQSMITIALDLVDDAERSLDDWIGQSEAPAIDDLRTRFDASVQQRKDRLASYLKNAEQSTTDSSARRKERIEAKIQQIAHYERLGQELTGITNRLERIAFPGGPPPDAA